MKHIDFPHGQHAVLLVHGLCSGPFEMQYLGKQLQKSGFAVRIPYIDGYAYSPETFSAEAAPWEQWEAQLEGHLDELLARHEQVAICGLCIGATLALSLAAKRPQDITALSLLSTTLFYDGWTISPFRFLLPLAYHTPLRVFYPLHRERPPFGLKNERLRAWIAQEIKLQSVSSVGAAAIPILFIHQAERLIRHVKRALPQVIAPTLLIHATEDDVASTRSPDLVDARIGTRRVKQLRLAHSYHMVTMDNEKDLVAKKTAGFLRETFADERREKHGNAHDRAG